MVVFRAKAADTGVHGVGVVEYIVLVLVIGGRLFLPFLIPYFPVVGLLSCLVLDSADQTIFQQFPAIPLDGYQSYDKALDIYYLTIAFLSTYRNWRNMPALAMAAFLFYYRLVGDLLFELTQARWLLFVFPNTFEYFFLFFELCRIRWDQERMTKKVVIVSAILIWVFIKLPQEWWIHIAQLDVTDFLRANTWVIIPMVVAIAVAVVVAWWVITHKAPAADRRFRLRADPLPPELTGAELYRRAQAHLRIFDWALAQKAVLAALVAVIFAQFLKDQPTPLQTFVSVVVFVIFNAFLSQWLARRGRSWRTVAGEMVAVVGMNFIAVAALGLALRLLGLRHEHAPIDLLLFFLFLLSMIIVLFDHYHLVYVMRRRLRKTGGSAPEEAPPATEAAIPAL
jgi:hypothetical protein